jgi:MFS family permease
MRLDLQCIFFHEVGLMRTRLGFTPYQWLVLFAAWLGWGFDVFDGLLFNYVAPICIPDLLHLPPKDAGAHVTFWTGALTSALLVGWALGGILFGNITDRIGRTRTLLLTMLTYALATAACAFAPNLWVLAIFRFVASLGIGGEWAAGASLVAETVPEDSRVRLFGVDVEGRVYAGALLYTSAPAGLFLATYVNDLFTRQLAGIAANPSLSWRLVFLTGLIPAAVAFIIRLGVKEPEKWTSSQAGARAPRIRELFSPELRARTLGGLAMAVTALVTWWSCNAFLTRVADYLAQQVVRQQGLPDASMRMLRATYITTGTQWFNWGGLVGTLLTIPIACYLGRRVMFALYFLGSSVCVWITFGVNMEPMTRFYAMNLLGLTTFGVFGAFTFYLPELFPTRLRGTGSGFCYNTGRFLTAIFPFLIGSLARYEPNPLLVIRWVAIAPLVGLLFLALGLGHETRGRGLE